jgi:hypothetical protein
VRIASAVVVSQIVCSLGLNTLWLSMMTGTGFAVLLSTRLIQALVTGAVQIVTIFALQGAFLLIKRQVEAVR